VLILAFALLAGSRTCSAVSVECSGCNVVAYTIHSRLSREDIDLHTPETLKASMEATCQSSGCGKKAGRCVRLMEAHGEKMAAQIKADGLRDLLGTQRQLCGELAEECQLELYEPPKHDEL